MTRQERLTEQEQREVFAYYAKHPTRGIRNAIAIRNGQLIWKIIHRRYDNWPNVEDLYQAGFIGLLEAVTRFEIDRNRRFSTYAYFWIDKYIRNCLDKEKMVSPHHSYYEYKRRVDAYVQTYMETYRKRPSICEISKALHMHRDIVYACVMEDGNPKVILFSMAVVDEDGCTLEDRIRDPRDAQQMVLDAYQEEQIVEELKELLTDQEYVLVIRKNGFCGYPCHTNQELADFIGVSKDTTRRRLDRAYAKIRKSAIAAG